ncbi:cell death protein 3-like [Babylonia areolata]|uniref:cell death protein 3-like n=1 Tax=Babylonia areolata TaxID=304850 RepID=UPI003FD53E18
MDYRFRETLRKSRIFLLENVIFDVLTDHLIDQDIFSDGMLDYIKAGSDRIEKIRRMLDYLVRRPNSCYDRFLTALNNSGHEHCVNYIQQNYVQSGATQVSDPLPPPTVPPTLPQSSPAWKDDEDVPMESSSSGSSEITPPPHVYPAAAENVRLGFPEISTSMNVYAGSFSTPVQESGVHGGAVTPSSASREGGGQEGMNGVEPAFGVLQSEVNSSFSHRGMFPVNLTPYDQLFLSSPASVYKMNSDPRGLALVINNETFTTLSPRMGSTRDMENLHFLFKRLGFKICHEKNRTAPEMRALLKSFAEYQPLESIDSLVVIILSHGGRGGIVFGRDGAHGNGKPQDYITDEEIQDRFSARNCPLMAQKPKLIVIQACRGLNEDGADGIRHHTPTRNKNNSTTTMDSGSSGTQLGQDSGSGSSSASSSMSASSSSRTANMADICLIHSTVHGYVAYRHPVDGSPFIQEMTSVFHEMADREHLHDMMTEVTRKLASRQLPEDLRTVPSTTNTLTKKWFLNPPHQ